MRQHQGDNVYLIGVPEEEEREREMEQKLIKQ